MKAYIWLIIPFTMFVCSIGMAFFAMLILSSGDVHGYAFLFMSFISVFLIYQEGKRYKEEVN